MESESDSAEATSPPNPPGTSASPAAAAEGASQSGAGPQAVVGPRPLCNGASDGEAASDGGACPPQHQSSCPRGAADAENRNGLDPETSSSSSSSKVTPAGLRQGPDATAAERIEGVGRSLQTLPSSAVLFGSSGRPCGRADAASATMRPDDQNEDSSSTDTDGDFEEALSCSGSLTVGTPRQGQSNGVCACSLDNSEWPASSHLFGAEPGFAVNLNAWEIPPEGSPSHSHSPGPEDGRHHVDDSPSTEFGSSGEPGNAPPDETGSNSADEQLVTNDDRNADSNSSGVWDDFLPGKVESVSIDEDLGRDAAKSADRADKADAMPPFCGSGCDKQLSNSRSGPAAVSADRCSNDACGGAMTDGVQAESSGPTTTLPAPGDFRFFEELPRELFFKVLGFLSQRELCLSVAPVCRDWRACARSPVLWQHLDLAEAGGGGGGAGGRDVGHLQLCGLLGAAPSLRSLSLRGREQLCLSELHMLAGCPLLTRLNLGFCDKVNGRLLDEVVHCCPNLEAINLEGCGQIDDDIAAQFPALACLKVLNLSHCTKLTDDGVVCISQGCLLLEDLNVDGIPWITDRAVKSLASERSLTLRAVYLDGAELTDLSVSYLTGCQLLGVLSVSFCEQLTDAALLMLESLNHLTYLRLKRGSEFSEEALRHFFEHGQVMRLQVLDLSECPELLNKEVTSIAHRCTDLRQLAICWCWNVSDVGIEEIIQCCSRLRVLDIIGLDKLRGDCLFRIPEALPHLTLLDVRQCNLIEDDMLVDLVKAKPNLKIFNYSGEEVTPDMYL